MANCGWFWSLCWFLILILLAWPIGFLCAIIYVLFSPFAACCSCCVQICDVIHKGLSLPNTCAVNMVSSKPFCS